MKKAIGSMYYYLNAELWWWLDDNYDNYVDDDNITWQY